MIKEKKILNDKLLIKADKLLMKLEETSEKIPENLNDLKWA